MPGYGWSIIRVGCPLRPPAVEQAGRVHLSSVSGFELATLVRRGRIRFDRDVTLWIRQALRDARVQPVSVTPEIAIQAASLNEEFPGDPADRLIYATAIAMECSLVTRDRRIRGFDSRRTVW